MKDRTILLVDDEPELLEMLRSIFVRAGYSRVLTAASARQALAVWQVERPEMLVLDVMLPDGDGLSLLRSIRRTSRVPVLLLTARGEAEDRFAGFESGADDYLVKPFLPRELLLRVQAILQRAYPERERRLYLAAATVDLDKAEVERDGGRVRLTAKELTLLCKLAENAGRIVSTGALCETLCGGFWVGYETTLSTHIRHLREKIEADPSHPVSLVTVKGLGYRLHEEGSSK